MMGKAKAQQRLIDNLEDEFAKVWIFLTISNLVVCIMHAREGLRVSVFRGR